MARAPATADAALSGFARIASVIMGGRGGEKALYVMAIGPASLSLTTRGGWLRGGEEHTHGGAPVTVC